MAQYSIKIDEYVDNSGDFAKPILNHLRELVHETCPEVEEAWKWSFPNFMYRGAILCSMAAFKHHCSFGFWKAAIMENEEGVLSVQDKVSMGHLGKITSLKDLPKDAVIKKYIKAAMKLNEDGIKVPPKPKTAEKKEIKTPEYFEKALKKNKEAKKVFDSFSYSNRKDYLEWFAEAKTEVTRDKRILQALEWLEEGKTRHWKYKNC
ncbi:hypothetical protein CJD36_001925 [Flavipsychrobacter stenotrophus]|uniref:YdhG-like domain-containing protein n=1 Tax=Flavipsychrobacter stenotrophus TaxID=2077091 RepID=A0A2S7T0X7_9BACT|nr:YdeI/OmpD-associated family protein [Flavipsychrobacter stenotrophus]PQJ12531.1 hypothetical protein CJD36_001925 [Flavipsychrobacter stenotrophus]